MAAIRKTIPIDSPYNTLNNDIGTIVAEDGLNRTFDISNISISHIRNVIGESVSTVGGLCRSSKVNQWALFRPSGSAPYKLGDFAGYNHQANPTTYIMVQLASGEFEIYRQPTTPYTTTVSFGLILKKGERPPAGQRNWRYIRLVATVSGGLTGTYSFLTEATDLYDPSIITIPIPSNDPVTFTLAITGHYVDDSNSVIIGPIEGVINTITVNAVPAYAAAPSALADNTYAPPEIRHYYTRHVGYNPPVISTFYRSGTVNDIQIEDGNFYTGLVKNIPNDIIGVEYGEQYGYTVFRTGSQWVKISLKDFYRVSGYTYKDELNRWFEVGTIATGYNFWRINSWVTDVEILTGWPVI